MPTEIKKCKVTYEEVQLKNCHPDCSKMKDNGKSWKNRDGDGLILGVKLSWTHYDNTTKNETIIVSADKKITDLQIDSFIKSTVIPPFENNMQDAEFESKTSEIIKKEEYRGFP